MTVAPPTPAASEVDVRTGWQHPVPDSPSPLGWADWIHTPPGCGETDPETARASREVRLQIRLAFPSVWRVHLEALPHYDSAYAYDERYDYEDDWTSDPNYRRAVQHFRTYDREGFVVPQGRHNDFIAWLVCTLRAAFGLRVLREPDLHVSPRTSEDAAFLTAGGKPKLKVQPDAVVLPQALDTDREHSKREHNIRLDQGDALPDLVVEVLSYSTEDNDLEGKWRLYAALGIREYLLIDIGEPQEPDATGKSGSPERMWLYRLDAKGVYQLVEDERPLRVCVTPIRLQPAAGSEMPYVQWLDGASGQWRDFRDDIKLKQEGQIEILVQALDMCLPHLDDADRERIVDSWVTAGIPDHMLHRIMKAGQAPDDWEAILDLTEVKPPSYREPL